MPERIVRVNPPKLTVILMSFLEPSTSSTRAMRPTRMSSLSRSSIVMGGLTGAVSMVSTAAS